MARQDRAARAVIYTIRGKLSSSMLLILSLCAFIFAAFTIMISVIDQQTTEISGKIAVLSWMSSAVDHSGSAIRNYALTGDLSYFKEYDKTISEFDSKLEELSKFSSVPETTQRVISLSNLYTAYVNAYINFYSNYSSMYKYYSTDFYDYYEQGEAIGGYIKSTIEEIREIEFQNSTTTYSRIIHNIQQFSAVMLALVLLVIVSVLFITYRITRDIAQPISKLAANADEIAHGNLEIKAGVPSNLHEIQILSNSFASMTASIQKLLQKTQEQAQLEISYREIRYQALLAQVNPHFLFNVLTCVSQSALSDGADEAVEMISYISTFLRYSLNNLRQSVTLADEVNNVKDYIYLQKMRLGSFLELHLQVDPSLSLSDIEFPWMILQPIVENCIVHAFESLPYPGKIDLQASERNSTIQVTIHDNGCGIPPDKLEQLMHHSRGIPSMGGKEHLSIGLDNIRERLHAYFRGNVTFLIESQLMEGTTVTIQTPMRSIHESRNLLKE